MKAHYESSEKNLYKNTIIVEQEIHSAWEASPLKRLRKFLPFNSEIVFESSKLLFIMKSIAFSVLYFLIAPFLFKIIGLEFLLSSIYSIYLCSLIILTLHSWFQYRYNNIFHRMGINPKSKEKEDIKKIITIFEVLTNNHYYNNNSFYKM